MLEEIDNQPELPKKHTVNFLADHNEKQENQHKKRKIFFIIPIIILVLFGAILIARAFNKPEVYENPYEYDPVTLEPKQPENFIKKITNFVFKRPPELEGQENDRINILLTGMGGPGHNGPFLTDTILLGSIKPSTGQIAIISIPRDLGVDIPNHGLQKINSANSYGEVKQSGEGAAFAAKIISNTFNIKIPYYARVDFEAFKEIIDAVGGIKINVDKTFTDREFPTANDAYQSLTFTAGAQTMDGSRALQYARSRHGNNDEGSDFARAKRQQKVLMALKEKILSFQTLANPIRISKIINSLGNHISTNIEFSNMISLLKLGRTMEMSKIINLVFDIQKNGYLESGKTTQGAYILSPKTGDFKDMQKAIKNIFELDGEEDTTPSQDVPAPQSINLETAQNKNETYKTSKTDRVEIQNGTWRAGLAARIREKLREENIGVMEVGNTKKRPVEKSGVYIVDKVSDPDILEKIKSALNMPIFESTPKDEISASSTNILIILGEDFPE